MKVEKLYPFTLRGSGPNARYIKVWFDHIEWGRARYERSGYYVYWWSWMGWRRIEDFPLIGLDKTWYDGPHAVFRLWPIAFSWQTPWMTYDEQKWEGGGE